MAPDPVLPPSFGRANDPLDAQLVRTCCAFLSRRAEALRATTPRERVTMLARVARAWRRRDYPFRVAARQRIAAATGFAAQVVDAGLDALFRAWSAPAMAAMMNTECPSIDWTATPPGLRGDGGRAENPGHHGAWVGPVAPRLAGHILSGNVPPPVVQSLFPALLSGAPSFLKVSSSEPWFGTLLARSIQEEAPELANDIAVASWSGDAEPLTQALFDAAEVVIAFGADTTIARLRAILPTKTRLIARPHRFSAGYVARESMTREGLPDLARAFAQDVALFDQAGCLSPQVVFVETEGALTPDDLARELASVALPAIASSLPPRRLSLDDAASLLQFKGVHTLSGTVYATPAGTVVVTRRPRYAPTGPGRTLFIRGVQDVAEALAFLEPVIQDLQAVAIAAGKDRWWTIAQQLALAGGTRFCRPGTLQSPPAAWPGDGVRPLAGLLRWVVMEPGPSEPPHPPRPRDPQPDEAPPVVR